MKVMKFGGTSVGSADRIKNVAGLVTAADGPKFLVLSAMSGTTNALIDISDKISRRECAAARAAVAALRSGYILTVDELFADTAARADISAVVDSYFGRLDSLCDLVDLDGVARCEILSMGELLSTHMMQAYMRSLGVRSVLLYAPDFLKLDAGGHPDVDAIHRNLGARLADVSADVDLYITQGFICSDFNGHISNLDRGGSDYTATLIGAAMGADVIEIWTDIDGLHNNDPRYVGGTRPVPSISYAQASALARYGAKILYSECVEPARKAGVAIRLLNTFEPHARGTLITGPAPTPGLRAAAALDLADGSAAVAIVSEPEDFGSHAFKKIMQDLAAEVLDVDNKIGLYVIEIDRNKKIETLNRLQPWLNI